jgi:hypothetical protein
MNPRPLSLIFVFVLFAKVPVCGIVTGVGVIAGVDVGAVEDEQPDTTNAQIKIIKITSSFLIPLSPFLVAFVFKK